MAISGLLNFHFPLLPSFIRTRQMPHPDGTDVALLAMPGGSVFLTVFLTLK
jgi:hypothetical protein